MVKVIVYVEKVMKQNHKSSRKITASYRQRAPHTVFWGKLTYDDIPLMIGVTDMGDVCRLSFVEGETLTSKLDEWKKAWKRTKFQRDQNRVAEAIDNIQSHKPLSLAMVGTEFQCAIWENILAIPSGETISYAELAKRAGRPRAVRAAGTACGANPVTVLVPCHRVLASNGGLGGFGGRLSTKKKLLKAEGFQEL